ncbi:(LipO)protein [Seminavis robusta]|uniref:(LipO)protein n=1 Tax=Seminavis robusta TaxID=568900 RepID=A0A9N8HCL3_9STRA|nr:(LipO)protein [Seminavis robusta]|eukprot:Sro223_g091340.1 (LipO)protein (559) ;mRNA; r:26432-28108
MELSQYDPNVKPDEDGKNPKQEIILEMNDGNQDNDASSVTAGIQPLPLPQTNDTLVADGCPGAFAVQSFRSRPAASGTDGFPALAAHATATDTTMESDGNNTQDQDHHLVEAHVVVDMEVEDNTPDAATSPATTSNDSDIVVVAEEIVAGKKAKQDEILSTGCSRNTTGTRVAWLAVGLTIILALVTTIVVLLFMMMQSNADTRKTNDGPVEDLVLVNNNTILNSTSNASQEETCFQSSQDLHDAIDAYIADDSPNSSISEHYGWPIGTWCVTKLRRFSFAFQIGRMRDPNLNADQANHITEQAAKWSPAIGGWDMSHAQDMEETFRGVQNLSSAWGIHHWNMTAMVSLKAMFMSTRWSQEDPLDLSSWDVSNVQSFNQLFRKSNVQQQANISNWNTAKLVNIGQFADRATQFNEDLSAWDTRKLKTLHKAFEDARSFDQDLSRWQVGSLTNMNSAFEEAAKFNSPLNTWDVSRVQSMVQTFEEAKQFNQDISGWNVSSVTDLSFAFKNASNFSQNLCSWVSLLPANVSVKQMFRHTNCPNTSDPVLSEGGPFCFNCG